MQLMDKSNFLDGVLKLAVLQLAVLYLSVNHWNSR